jgi:endo-alpha-1,4-polygalactosaminidase (GH114 family)
MIRTLFALAAALLLAPTAALASDLPPPVANAAAWKPTTGLSWQLQYIKRLDTSVRADVFKIDLFDTPPETIAALKAGGKRAVCYLNAGAWEDWRADAGDFTGAALGNAYEGWPGERWIDIRNIGALAPVMLARLDLCRDKGFDGVVLDNVNSYTHRTGFPLSAVDQLRYNAWLANEAHKRGLAVGMNNNAQQARELAPYFDWALAEGCLSGGWCQSLRPFSELGKPVVVIEYTDSRTRLALFCHQASVLRISVLAKKRELDAYRMDCRTFPTRTAL